MTGNSSVSILIVFCLLYSEPFPQHPVLIITPSINSSEPSNNRTTTTEQQQNNKQNSTTTKQQAKQQTTVYIETTATTTATTTNSRNNSNHQLSVDRDTCEHKTSMFRVSNKINVNNKQCQKQRKHKQQQINNKTTKQKTTPNKNNKHKQHNIIQSRCCCFVCLKLSLLIDAVCTVCLFVCLFLFVTFVWLLLFCC